MSARVKITYESFNPNTGIVTTRTISNVTNVYIAAIGATTTDVGEVMPATIATVGLPFPPIPGGDAPTPILSEGYTSFWEWADAVARGILSLSVNTYRDCNVITEWSVTEELNA